VRHRRTTFTRIERSIWIQLFQPKGAVGFIDWLDRLAFSSQHECRFVNNPIGHRFAIHGNPLDRDLVATAISNKTTLGSQGISAVRIPASLNNRTRVSLIMKL
jgi:hypothetical protein